MRAEHRDGEVANNSENEARIPKRVLTFCGEAKLGFVFSTFGLKITFF